MPHLSKRRAKALADGVVQAVEQGGHHGDYYQGESGSTR